MTGTSLAKGAEMDNTALSSAKTQHEAWGHFQGHGLVQAEARRQCLSTVFSKAFMPHRSLFSYLPVVREPACGYIAARQTLDLNTNLPDHKA